MDKIFMKQEHNQNIEKLIEMVKDARTCMLITNEQNDEMVVLFNMLKAIVTGKEYAEGEHGKINL